MTTKTTLRTNANGLRNLADLRKAIGEAEGISVHRQGGNWIISRYSAGYGATVENPCHPLDDERAAIEQALGLDRSHAH